MKKKYYLGIDQGTTGVTAILFDRRWTQVSRGYCEEKLYYPKAGWVEHDPEDVWQCVLRSVLSAMEQVGATGNDIICVGLDHEGESVAIWDEQTGKALYNSLVWQDRRTAAYCDTIRSKYGKIIKEKTHLPVDSYFSATKLQWLLEHVDSVPELLQKKRLRVGNMDAWVLWKMSGGAVHCTDGSTASRTMLYNVQKQCWDDDLLELFGIPKEILPTICDSNLLFGWTNPASFLGISAPISGVLNDQQAALLGQACTMPGKVKTTYGTGCFMFMNTGEHIVDSPNGILPTVAWLVDGKATYALDGGVYISGAATQWLRDGLQIIESAADTDAIASSIDDTNGLFFVPAFTGLAAPYWDSYARGMMIGITGSTTREDIVRATLESTAYQVKDLLDVMEKDTRSSIPLMRCDGGASNNQFLMQFQADILGIPVEVPVIKETTALGAAFMAALGIGEFDSLDDVKYTWKLERQYEPSFSDDKRESMLHEWHRAVERSRNWAINT